MRRPGGIADGGAVGATASWLTDPRVLRQAELVGVSLGAETKLVGYDCSFESPRVPSNGLSPTYLDGRQYREHESRWVQSSSWGKPKTFALSFDPNLSSGPAPLGEEHDPAGDEPDANPSLDHWHRPPRALPADPVSGLDGMRSRLALLSWAGQLSILPVAQQESMQ